jgi:hypothetical protein
MTESNNNSNIKRSVVEINFKRLLQKCEELAKQQMIDNSDSIKRKQFSKVEKLL